MTPQRVRLSRARGARKPPGAVNVARPTKWGNPFMLRTLEAGGYMVEGPPVGGSPYRSGVYLTQRDARHEAVRLFVRWWTRPGIDGFDLKASVGELTGADLACWCPLDQACHADVLLDWANPTEVER